MAHRAAFVFCCSFLVARLASAESMAPPTCRCNDDCKHVWPYSGICVAQYGYRYCAYAGSGSGIPCDAGPAVDLGKKCSCNDDCAGSAVGPYCVNGPYGARCTNSGWPGTACDGRVRADVDPPWPDDGGWWPTDDGGWRSPADIGWFFRDDGGPASFPDGGPGPAAGLELPDRGCSCSTGAALGAELPGSLLLGLALIALTRRSRRG